MKGRSHGTSILGLPCCTQHSNILSKICMECRRPGKECGLGFYALQGHQGRRRSPVSWLVEAVREGVDVLHHGCAIDERGSCGLPPAKTAIAGYCELSSTSSLLTNGLRTGEREILWHSRGVQGTCGCSSVCTAPTPHHPRESRSLAAEISSCHPPPHTPVHHSCCIQHGL